MKPKITIIQDYYEAFFKCKPSWGLPQHKNSTPSTLTPLTHIRAFRRTDDTLTPSGECYSTHIYWPWRQTPIGKRAGLWINTMGESHQMSFACVICCSFSTTLAPTPCQNLHNCLGVDVTGNWARVIEDLVEFSSITVWTVQGCYPVSAEFPPVSQWALCLLTSEEYKITTKTFHKYIGFKGKCTYNLWCIISWLYLFM